MAWDEGVATESALGSRADSAWAEFWSIEAACRAAWPAREERVVGPWVLRRSGGTTRRTNSINPIATDRHDPLSVLEVAYDFYREKDLPSLFRLPSFLPETIDALERADYRAEAETATLACDLKATTCGGDPEVELRSDADPTWIQAKRRLTPTDDEQQRVFEDMLARIDAPARFASLTEDGSTRAVAYGVVAEGHLVLEAVVTDPEFRRRGLSRRIVETLLAWGRESGAEAACLQVVSDNLPARRLYAGVGFDRELYRYAYYRPPA